MTDQQCNTGLTNVTSQGSGKGVNFNIVTRLIPDLQFTCNGRITQLTVGGAIRSGQQQPEIQIWREQASQCGTYFKPVPDFSFNESVCDGGRTILSSGVYHCLLKEAFQLEVQQGDILGLELAPKRNDGFEFFFTNGGPRNYVFLNRFSSTGSTVLSSRATEVEEQPQINIVVEIAALPKGRYNYFGKPHIAMMKLTFTIS